MTRCFFAVAMMLGLASEVLAADIPRKAPELATQLPNGQQMLLSQFRGKVVLIEFVHTTCIHCQQNSAILERLYKELGPKGFQPIAVAFNQNAAQLVPDFVRQLGLSFLVGVAGRDTVLTYLQKSVRDQLFVPQMVFVDRKGVIRAQHGGEDQSFFSNPEWNVRAEVEKLLKEQVTAPSRSRLGRRVS